MKIKKNPHQTIKFNKKKIHIVRSTSQNPKRTRSLSNNAKISSSKKSDESGNTREEGQDENSSNGKKVSKVDKPTNWQVKGTNIEKIAALASISKYSNTGNFTSDDFQNCQMKKDSQNPGPNLDKNLKNLNMKEMNPISPTSTKSLIENDNFQNEAQNKALVAGNAISASKGHLLSMTLK